MTQIKNYNYFETKITHFVKDETSGSYLWLGFQKSDTTCTLKKVFANNPLQVFYNINITTDAIKKLYIDGNYLYVALDDPTLIGKRYSITNPLTTVSDHIMHAGITEAPVDVLVDGSKLYYLIPGDTSGICSKILEYTTSGIYTQTINLTTVQHAKSFTMDGADIWVVTFESPAHLIRVFNLDSTPEYTVI